MIYDDFVKLMIEQGKKIVPFNGNVPAKYPKFYSRFNPVRVYVEYDSNYIHLLPIDELEKMTKKYRNVECDLVFATCNSDPIFLKNGKVYTCEHGANNPKIEFLANSFEDFLKMVMRG